MAEHEPTVGLSDEWYTPPEVADRLGVFDMDVSAPRAAGRGAYSIQADSHLTADDDGLASPWSGLVWMNPPFGGRLGHLPWLARFVDHGNGVGLCRAYTSAAWFHDWMGRMGLLLFPRGKTKFVRQDGVIGKSPGHGIVLFALGEGVDRLAKSSIPGWSFRVDQSNGWGTP